MKHFPDWMKTGLVIIGGLAVLSFAYSFTSSFFGVDMASVNLPTASPGYGGVAMMESADMGMAREMAVYDGAKNSIAPQPPFDPDVPPTGSADRIIITDTNLSLVVDSVKETIDQVNQVVEQAGGFLVNSYLNSPTEAASGSITVRVPSDQRDGVVAQIKDLGLRVSSESVSGRDVTDQYEDLEARLRVLRTTREKFEGIQEQATEIQDLLTVQRELINVQSQLDSVQGRIKYLEESANLSKITINLATDELALPLTPDNAWRPQLVFKQAVRSMLQTLRQIGYTAIWLGVYSVIFIPAGVVGYGVYRLVKAKRQV